MVEDEYEEPVRATYRGGGGGGGGGYSGYEGGSGGGRAARYVEDYDDGYEAPAAAAAAPRYATRGGGGGADYDDRGGYGPDRRVAAVSYRDGSAPAYAKEEAVAPRTAASRGGVRQPVERGSYEGGGGAGGRYEPY